MSKCKKTTLEGSFSAVPKPVLQVYLCILFFAFQKRHFEENIEKREKLCLEKFGMPEEANATGLKISA